MNDENIRGGNSYTKSSTLPLKGDLGAAPVAAERQMYEAELSKVRKENSFLKDQVSRLVSELRDYQVQYPYANVGRGAPVMLDLPPWMGNGDVMSPLFKAYDSRISELSSVTEKQRVALDSFGEQVREISWTRAETHGAPSPFMNFSASSDLLLASFRPLPPPSASTWSPRTSCSARISSRT